MQRQRAWTPKDVSIAKVVGELTQGVRRQAASRAKAEEALAAAPRESLPIGVRQSLAAWVRAASLSRGTLTLIARDAASRYRVQQWLRSGGEGAIRASSPGVHRIRITLEEDGRSAAGGGKGGGP